MRSPFLGARVHLFGGPCNGRVVTMHEGRYVTLPETPGAVHVVKYERIAPNVALYVGPDPGSRRCAQCGIVGPLVLDDRGFCALCAGRCPPP